jgi:chromosome segregation ATPase
MIAERDVKERVAATKVLEEALESNKTEVNRLKDTLAAMKAEHEEEVKHLRQGIMQIEHELRAQLSQAQQLLAEEQTKSAKAEMRYKEAHESHIQSIKQLGSEFEGNTDDTKEKLLVAQDNIRQLENKLSNLEGEKLQLVQNGEAEMQRLKHALESCHKDLGLALMQKEETAKMVEVMTTNTSQQSKQLEECKRAAMKADEQCQLIGNEKVMMQRKIDELVLEKKEFEQRMQIVTDNMVAYKKEASIWKDKSSEAQKKAGEVRILVGCLSLLDCLIP